jgi:hypothetical protein
MSTSYHPTLKFGLKNPPKCHELVLFEAMTISVLPYKKQPLNPSWAPDQLLNKVPFVHNVGSAKQGF